MPAASKVLIVGAAIVFSFTTGAQPTFFARTDEEVAVIAHQGSDLMALGEGVFPLTQAEVM